MDVPLTDTYNVQYDVHLYEEAFCKAVLEVKLSNVAAFMSDAWSPSHQWGMAVTSCVSLVQDLAHKGGLNDV